MLDNASSTHAVLMDQTYRHQRLIYDLTRKYYLLGRDRLIDGLAPKEGSHVLEVACGTGRNLKMASRKYPHSAFYGLDISTEMLTSARQKVGAYVQLAQADACRFDGARLFRRSKFDRIFISYGLSMIPDWQAALRMSCAHLAPGGQLHVLDFSDQAGWPRWFGNGLNHWLANFHVTPRLDLCSALETVAAESGGHAQCSQLYRGYSQYSIVHMPG